MNGAYRSYITQIPMQRLGRMQERTRYPQALHARHCLPPHEPALPHAAHNQLAASLGHRLQALDRLQQPLARRRVRLVQEGDLRQRRGGRGEDVDGARQETRALGVVDAEGRGEHGIGAGALALHACGREGEHGGRGSGLDRVEHCVSFFSFSFLFLCSLLLWVRPLSFSPRLLVYLGLDLGKIREGRLRGASGATAIPRYGTA